MSTYSPSNSSTLNDTTVTFFWNSISNATYSIRVSQNASFSLIFYSSDGILNEDITINNFIYDTTYYWKVGAVTGVDTAWSNTKSFSFLNPALHPNIVSWYLGDSLVYHNSNIIDKIENIITPTSDSIAQSIISKKPFLLENDSFSNFHKTILFDGVDDNLKSTIPITLGSTYIVSKWNGNSATFPNNNGLFTSIIGGNPSDYIFHFISGTSSLRSNGFFGTNIFVNNLQTMNIGDINRSKIIYGFNNSPQVFNNFLIGGSLDIPARSWNGTINEVLIYDSPLSSQDQDLVFNYLKHKYFPPINLGKNISSSNFCSKTLNAHKKWYESYLWSTGSTDSSITISTPGTYYLSVTDVFGFSSSDTIQVFYPEIFATPLTDTTICYGDTLTLNSQLDTVGYSFLWSDNSTDSLITITTPGQYWVTVTDTFGCSSTSDTINVTIDSLSIQTSLGPNKTVCRGSSISLTAGNTLGLSYLWNTGDTTAQITIDTAGTYFIQVTNSNNCIGKDTVVIDTSGIAPTVSFSIQSLCTNSPALFINLSSTNDGSNITLESWTFGDGDTTTLQNPSHLYTSNTSFIVTLEITTDSGCVNTLDSTIQIHNPPTAGFFATTNPICSGQTTSFSDNSFSTDGTINSWMWNFGDTGTLDTSSLQDPDYQFPITSIYSVQVIATTQYVCSDTTTNSITVKQSPIALFTSSDYCENKQTKFNSTSQGNIFSLDWDFGDSNTSSLSNPTNTYTNPGNFTVNLIATEVNGCTDTISTGVIINSNPIAQFTSLDYCALSANQLFDSSTTISGIITTWDWNIVNHTNQSNNQNPTFTFPLADTGLYFIDLMVTTDLGCNDSIRDSINVFPLPIPNFTFNPITGAPPLLVNFTNQTNGVNSYNWNFGDDSTSTSTSPSHLYIDSSTYFINLVATNLNGCKDSISKSILVIDPITDIAVTNVTYDFISNSKFLSISAELTNFGTLTINDLDLEAEVSGSGTILEKWAGSINGGAQTTFQFTSSFEVNGEIPDLICIRATNPNGQNDANITNNEFCIAVNKFQLISISPNPTSNIINLNFIIPSAENTTVNLYNSSGKKVAELFSGILEIGLIKQTYNLFSYGGGIYILEIRHQGQSIKEKILIK